MQRQQHEELENDKVNEAWDAVAQAILDEFED